MAGSINDLNRLLLERTLLDQPKENDTLVLDDATLVAALDRTRALTRSQWIALLDSPLTLRRFRVLSNARRASARAEAEGANGRRWAGSEGLRLAADTGAELSLVHTEDGYWSLHFLREGGGWRVVLKLDAAAPIAPDVLRANTPLRVLDGEGYPIAEGVLDADGELDCEWPFPEAPAEHFRRCGGSFTVKPAR